MTGETVEVLLSRTVELAAVPGPPLDEADRAAVVDRWWRIDGLRPRIDRAGNVVAQLRMGEGPATLVAAHLDTVFGRDIRHGTEQRDGRLYGVGVGDNSVAVAALSLLNRLLPRKKLSAPVWIAATTGEEGLGNLAGARHLLKHPPDEIGAFIALEGNYLGRVVTTGVGSVRWRVELEGPGGHAWEAADIPSAIHDLARIIVALEGLVPDARSRARCSLNVGHIEGGESINARARRAAFRVDIRSADQTVLADLEAAARRVVDTRSPLLTATYQELGRRPAGSIPETHPLVAAADAALAALGINPEHVATSTDANAAYAAGIPAITIGITYGSGEHTPGEWIETGPIGTGLAALADTIVRYDREAG